MPGHAIKALLIDSGRVLNGPASGHWFISPKFYTYVDRKTFQSISSSKRQNAFYHASQYISQQPLIQNEEEEYTHFVHFYSLFSQYLPGLDLDEMKVHALAEDLVYNRKKYAFFNDVLQCLPELSKSFKLAVVSDAWPSLEPVFVDAGMRDYFSSFIISSKLGVTKPNPLMYRLALEELGIKPEESLFIDDSLQNCEGAEQLGIRSLRMLRDWRMYTFRKLFKKEVPVVRDFYGVMKRLNQR